MLRALILFLSRRGESVFPCPLLRLPARLLVKLLSYLDTEDLVRVSATCSRLYATASDPSLWSTIR